MSLLARTLMFTAALTTGAVVIGTHHPASAAAASIAAPPATAQAANKYGEVCASCHQADGKGLEGAIPPLAGSEWLVGRPNVPIAIVLHGVQGEITVKGKKYNGAMMAWGSVLNDADLAATLTYARSQWGNKAAPITAAQVKAVRAKLASRTEPFTPAELKALK